MEAEMTRLGFLGGYACGAITIIAIVIALVAWYFIKLGGARG